MIHDQKFYYVIKEGIPLSQMTWSIINNTAVYVGSLGMGALGAGALMKFLSGTRTFIMHLG